MKTNHVIALSAILLVACGGRERREFAQPDSGETIDAATSDLGALEEDSGLAGDTGASDAESAPSDASVLADSSFVDAGTHMDSSVPVDAGSDPDLGSSSDAGSSDAGSPIDLGVDASGTIMGTWHLETIMATGMVGMYPSLKIDSAGLPHVAYANSAGGPSYAYLRDDVWHTETVDSEHTAFNFALMLDASDEPRIGWGSYERYFASRVDGEWQTSTAPGTLSSERYGVSISGAVESTGESNMVFITSDTFFG